MTAQLKSPTVISNTKSITAEFHGLHDREAILMLQKIGVYLECRTLGLNSQWLPSGLNGLSAIGLPPSPLFMYRIKPNGTPIQVQR